MKKISIFSAIALALTAAWFLFGSRPAPELSAARDNPLPPAAMDRALASTPAAPAATNAIMEPLANQPLAEEEKRSVDSLARLLASSEEIHSSQELAGELKRAGLDPVIGRDENPDTGRLDIVRTNDALPGTRYFHAQIFNSEGQPGFAQHVSFQVRPGTDSMEVALAAIRESHRGLGNPQMQQDGFVMWRTKEGRIITAKRMTSEDLRDNPFNAQDPVADVGTIWVMSEDDPDDDGTT